MAVPAAVLHVPPGPPRALPPANLSPLSATLTSHPQLIENTSPLSPVFATLTSRVTRKSFACHSYEKTPGGMGHIAVPELSELSNLSTFKPSSALRLVPLVLDRTPVGAMPTPIFSFTSALFPVATGWGYVERLLSFYGTGTQIAEHDYQERAPRKDRRQNKNSFAWNTSAPTNLA